MTPERWQQVRELFASALEREPGLRAAYLDQACAGASELRREVESLLAAHDRAGSFLELAAALTGASGQSTRDQTSALPPGSRLGPYEVVELLGAGGMGQVYRARDSRLGRDVALKVLPEMLQRDPVALARFTRETRAIAALSHPNILSIFDVGEHNGVRFAVVELLEGETLHQRLTRSRPATEEVTRIALAIAEGLAAAHGRGIVHRDLKPENIFLTIDGRVKILDFGLARGQPPPAGEETSSATTEAALTTPGVLMGTLGYMAPEQARGEETDSRTDVFALGCVFYETLCGCRPFVRATAAETLAAILHADPFETWPSSASVSPRMMAVVRRCLQKDPSQRYSSGADVLSALRTALPPSAAVAPTRLWPTLPRLAALALIALTLAALAVRWRRPAAPPPTPTLLVVLPFDNMTGDPEQEYLGSGLTEELITRLGRMQPSRLRVIARASATACKSARKSAAQMASELGVQYILEGSVRRSGGRLRVSAQLVEAKDQIQVWAESYERQLGDSLALEDEVAHAVARALRPVITPTAEAARASPSAEVRDAYLRGRYQWNKRTREGLEKARLLFEDVIRLVPDYAPAHSGLADVYLSLYDYQLMPPAEANLRAREAARSALAHDPLLAEAHTSLAHVDLHDWDWAASESEFRRALELDPGYVTAHHWYALCLTALGRVEEAVSQMRIARELDPLSRRVNADLGMALLAAHRDGEAIEQERRTLELDPSYPGPYFIRGMAYELAGQVPSAINDYEEAVRRSQGDSNTLASLGHAYALAGRQAEARKIGEDLAAGVARGSASPFDLVLVYVGLGDKESALHWLQKAYLAHSGSLRYVKVDRRLDPLRSDPRYQDLMRRVGLPP